MDEPAQPINQLTNRELADYRREVEAAVAAVPGHVVLGELKRRLDEIIGQQEWRKSIAAVKLGMQGIHRVPGVS